MKIKQIAMMQGGQDGAFWGNYLFRFDDNRHAWVYDATLLDQEGDEERELPLVSTFELNSADSVFPHCNAVSFGAEYYEKGDEFPLLYANVYNNYAKEADKKEGICLVYRVLRKGLAFSATLVQQIKIGFTDDRELWRSAGDQEDVRPYGNFLVDPEKRKLYAFTMRDADQTTRYFTFDLPALGDGELVTLSKEDVLDWFDTPYHRYIQGGCYHEGRIYSSEGFGERIHPALRVIDLQQKKQIHYADLWDMGYGVEAEWIDFRKGNCYYSDARGRIYQVDFED